MVRPAAETSTMGANSGRARSAAASISGLGRRWCSDDDHGIESGGGEVVIQRSVLAQAMLDDDGLRPFDLDVLPDEQPILPRVPRSAGRRRLGRIVVTAAMQAFKILEHFDGLEPTTRAIAALLFKLRRIALPAGVRDIPVSRHL